MADDIKLPVFKGTGLEDLEQFLFLCEAVWTTKHINDENIKKKQLVMTLQDENATRYEIVR